ncbi:hypothetical protein EOA27_01920 [Mesorhizobium sp. M2A.F.Ca.ET.037.01.1.1]|uniref:ABC transporter substrate-binding protein n=1 Tax=unclassified Mesorhizobium TaxID=325217 RepID=UPI000F75D427|nr:MULTISPECIES: ABC transporter substrate-binding protein [unclassified Mesorhizobium]RUY10941.1 hypothetical protein EOA25_07320 [Mesorhizobium sp. M2A.F.Ca.ET.040.01.1.1]AZO16140.1 hypothetical protein EJ069_16320 [Mesorhizobium sp. M2A.F.Ca.ET.043.05.1.1]RUX22959.1 hypothetical protein EOA27_01920 [Mesorhizobium sp. M2A.F.Ca.ET.037.01.1.1]RWA83574.1 MAG: hypothetical protein EOQ31_28855 [Mesorhizobium sp.]TIV18177.1 MAG: hypothetical protein E5V95_14615 [Mesorhizobium sp.]
MPAVHIRAKFLSLSFTAALLLGAGTLSASAKDTLVVAIPGTPQGIDLNKDVSPQTWIMAAQVYDEGMQWEAGSYPFGTGAAFDPRPQDDFSYPDLRSGKLKASIIDRCELSADGKKATILLRKGVKSAPGNEFTAGDVLWRVDRALATKAIDAFLMAIANVDDRAKWSKVDDYTVNITSEQPMPLACTILTNNYWPWYDSTEIKKHATAEDPWGDAWISQHGGGFGPYSVTTWEAGKRVVMDANPNYWRGELPVKRIIFQVVPESTNRLALLNRGTVDIADGLSPDQIMSLSGSSVAKPIAVKGNQNLFIVINNALDSYKDARVRQAINLLIPRQDIVKNIYRGMAAEFQGVYPSIYPGHVTFADFSYDPAKAKELLAAAGVTNLSDELIYSADDPVQESIAILLKTSFADAGIDLTLKKLPVAALASTVQSKQAHLALWIDFPIQPDPSYASTLIYSSTGAVNYEKYKNEKVDELLTAGRSVTGMEERIKAHEEVQKLIHADAPLGWVVEPYFGLGFSNKVRGYKWYPGNYYQVRDLNIAP